MIIKIIIHNHMRKINEYYKKYKIEINIKNKNKWRCMHRNITIQPFIVYYDFMC